jgi:hypothetical protein
VIASIAIFALFDHKLLAAIFKVVGLDADRFFGSVLRSNSAKFRGHCPAVGLIKPVSQIKNIGVGFPAAVDLSGLTKKVSQRDSFHNLAAFSRLACFDL